MTGAPLTPPWKAHPAEADGRATAAAAAAAAAARCLLKRTPVSLPVPQRTGWSVRWHRLVSRTSSSLKLKLITDRINCVIFFFFLGGGASFIANLIYALM